MTFPLIVNFRVAFAVIIDLVHLIFSLQLVLPEYGLHAFLMLLFLFGGFWIVFAMNVPLLCYNIYRFVGFSLQHAGGFNFL